MTEYSKKNKNTGKETLLFDSIFLKQMTMEQLELLDIEVRDVMNVIRLQKIENAFINEKNNGNCHSYMNDLYLQQLKKNELRKS